MQAIVWFLLGALVSFSNLYFYIFSFLGFNRQTPYRKDRTFPVLCYFVLDKSWPDNGTLHPALNATLCTHILFISTTIKNSEIALADQGDGPKYFEKIPVLKKINPKLKVFVSNGGGGNEVFSPVLASAENRTRFTKSIIPFLKKYGLDGIDMDWEFPGFPPNPPGQTENFTMLLQEVRDVFHGEILKKGTARLQLSAAVAAGRSVMASYNISALARILDFINLMCYDFHGYEIYDPITGYNAPLYPKTWREKPVFFSGDTAWAANKWNESGMPKEKIMVGIPTYGHTWTLMFPEEYHDVDAPATGHGPDGDEQGYPYICKKIANGSKVVWDDDAAVPYTYKDSLWISYDNERSVYEKTKWIVENMYGGIMVYAMNDDDYMGECDGKTKFPLISNITSTIHDITEKSK